MNKSIPSSHTDVKDTHEWLGKQAYIVGANVLGYLDHYVDYLYQERRWCVQIAATKSNVKPESFFTDQSMIAINGGINPVMAAPAIPLSIVPVGAIVSHPHRRWGRFRVTARAVYVNGCSRLLLESYRCWLPGKPEEMWENEQLFIAQKHNIKSATWRAYPVEHPGQPERYAGGPGRADSRR